MKIVEPHCEYWPQTNMYEHIANIASVCYHSPKKEGEKAKKMVENLIKRNHISTTRHCSMYFIVPRKCNDSRVFLELNSWDDNPYINIKYNYDSNITSLYWVSTNYNFLLDNPHVYDVLESFEVTPEEFMKECPELMRFTFCLTTQLSTSRELNRKSPNNIMEESTRYILYSEDGKAEPAICRPHWFTSMDNWTHDGYWRDYTEQEKKEREYFFVCCESFNKYGELLNLGMKQEDARGVLPLDTKTTVIYTYSVKEWSDIFKLRYLDMTGKAHMNCKVIMELVLEEFIKLGYTLNDKGDLIYNEKCFI